MWLIHVFLLHKCKIEHKSRYITQCNTESSPFNNFRKFELNWSSIYLTQFFPLKNWQLSGKGGMIFSQWIDIFPAVVWFGTKLVNKIHAAIIFMLKKLKNKNLLPFQSFLGHFLTIFAHFVDPRMFTYFWHKIVHKSRTVNNWRLIEPILKIRGKSESYVKLTTVLDQLWKNYLFRVKPP